MLHPTLTVEKYTDIHAENMKSWISPEYDTTVINQIVNHYIKSNVYYLSSIMIVVKFNHKFYIVDGRLMKRVMKRLYDTHKIDSTITVIRYECKHKRNVDDLFDNLHKHNEIIKQQKLELDEHYKIIEKLKLSNETTNIINWNVRQLL